MKKTKMWSKLNHLLLIIFLLGGCNKVIVQQPSTTLPSATLQSIDSGTGLIVTATSSGAEVEDSSLNKVSSTTLQPSVGPSAVQRGTAIVTPPVSARLPCLPKAKSELDRRPLKIEDIIRQAEASGNLPATGGMTGYHHYLTYDNQALIFQWAYSIDHINLVAYHINDQSVIELGRIVGEWAVSPTNDCIIFAGSTAPADIAGALSPENGLKMVDSRGQELQFEIDVAGLELYWTAYWSYPNFTWSPDGSAIAFNLDSKECPYCDNIYQVNIDGSHLGPLWPNATSEYFHVLELSWSPQTNEIAVIASYPDQEKKIRQGLFLITVNNGKRLTILEDGAVEMFWSDDGIRLYFTDIDSPPCNVFDVVTKEIVTVDRAYCKP